jgi:ubiquinone/menaquinone biosynthesis C-methylase UbiE
MAYQWVDYDPNFVRQRYDRLADIIALFDWLFCIPPGLRKLAVDRLNLKSGDCVLEVGCGSGRNFPFLRDAVGSTGRIYGVDLSPGMLRRARKLRDRHHWANIHLSEGDAINYAAPEPVDGVLFSFAYNTMPHHLTVLHRMWKQLRPGGRLVIVDSKLPPGLGGKLLLPFSLWLMRHTLLGNPYIRPWEHHAELVTNFEMEEFLFASYYVCRGVKPIKSRLGVRAPSQRRNTRRHALDLLRRRLDGEGGAKERCKQKQQRNLLTAPGRRIVRLPRENARNADVSLGRPIHLRARRLAAPLPTLCAIQSIEIHSSFHSGCGRKRQPPQRTRPARECRR